jgi:hypothetical protein
MLDDEFGSFGCFGMDQFTLAVNEWATLPHSRNWYSLWP